MPGEPEIFVFVLSFVVIARFWLVHHAMFNNVVGYNSTLLWVNFLWLLAIVFLSFATELLASPRADELMTAGLYIGTMVVVAAAGLAMQCLIVGTPQLQRESVRGTLSIVPSLVATSTLLVALMLAVTMPRVGLWALLLMVVTGPVERLIAHRRAAGPR